GRFEGFRYHETTRPAHATDEMICADPSAMAWLPFPGLGYAHLDVVVGRSRAMSGESCGRSPTAGPLVGRCSRRRRAPAYEASGRATERRATSRASRLL